MPALGLGGLALAGALGALWAISVAKRDASIIDGFWGLGFVGLAWLYVGLGEAPTPRALLVASLVTAWGVRLSTHIIRRSLGAPEDYRYAAMRRAWGERFWWVSLGTVFGLQGILLWTIGMPLYVVAQRPASGWGPLDVVGLLLFAVGLGFEAVADAQLSRFKANPENRGRTLQTGLWRYTRHPNYFGDAMVWWGLYVVADLASGGGWTVFAPLLMTGLLMRVSGVPMLERHMRSSRPDFADYAARTNAFFPGPPKKRTTPGPP